MQYNIWISGSNLQCSDTWVNPPKTENLQLRIHL